VRKRTSANEDSAPGIIPAAPWRVVSVRVLPGYRLFARFVDGTEGEVDMSALVKEPNAGVFAELADPVAFSKAFVHPFGHVEWPTGQDLAPDTMHDEIARNGRWLLR
jgi:hypothetical protein